MIPLRILHVVAEADGPDAVAAQALAIALRTAGHASTRAGPGQTGDAISYRTGRWPWITGERTRAVQRVAQWMPDVIHVHGVHALGPPLDIARRLGLGVVASLTQGEDPHAARRLRDPRIGWVVVPTEHLRAHALGRIGISRDRLALIPPLAPSVTLRSATGPAWRLGILTAPEAGLAGPLRDVLAGVAGVQSSGLALEAQVHTGWLTPSQRTALDPLLETYGVQGSTAALPEFLAGVDAVALAGRRELPAVAVLAALAAGLPVLAPAIGGIPELITDGSLGLLVAGTGPEAWAGSIRQLHDHRRRCDMGAAARQEVRERFREADAIDALVALYRSTLGQGGAAAKAEVSQTWRRLSDARAR